MPQDYYWGEQPKDRSKETATATVRGAAGGAIPWALRMGTGFGSFMGTGIGAGIAGGGETLAQMIERGTIDPRDLNWKRIAFEAGLGAIPGAKLVRPGFLKSAGLGALMAAGGLAGRKITGETPEERAIDLPSDLTQIGVGAGAGGTIGAILGKMAKRGAPKPPEIVITDSGGNVLKRVPGTTPPAPAAPPLTGAVEPPRPLIPPPGPGAGVLEQLPSRPSAKAVEKADLERLARNEKARERYERTIVKAREAADAEEAARIAVDRAKKGLEPQLPTVSEATSFTDVAGRHGVRQGFEPADQPSRARTPAGGVLPMKPVAPKPGVFQIVRPDGTVVEAADADTALALVNRLGPQATVIQPSDLPAPPKITGTARQVVEQQGPAPPTPAGPAAGRDWVANPPRTPAEVAEYMAAKAGVAGGAGTPAVTPIKVISPTEVATTIRAPKPPDEPPAPAPVPIVPKPTAPPAPAPAAAEPLVPAAVAPEGAGIPPVPPVGLGPSPAARPSLPPDLDARAKAFRLARERALADPNTPPEVIQQLQLAGRALQKEHAEFYRNAKAAAAAAKIPGAAPAPTSTAGPASIPAFGGTPVAPIMEMPTGPPRPGPETQEAFAIQPSETLIRLRGGPGAPGTPSEAARAGPAMPAAKPIPPDLQMRIQTAQNQMQILQNAGKGNTEAAQTLGKELVELTQQRFAAEYPELAAELAKAEQASKRPAAGRGGPKIGANPMFDPEAYRWAAEQLGPEGIGALLGGGVGALAYEDDPLLGAMVGAGAGYGGGKWLRSLHTPDMPLISIDPANRGESIARLLSAGQRFNYLLNPFTLGINVGPAPVGAGIMGGLERMAVGGAEKLTGADPSATARVQEGTEMLRHLLGSRGVWSGERWQRAWDEARGLIGRSERAEELPGETIDRLRLQFSGPGRMLTTGDVVVRGALIEAGVPEDIARAITLTANPRYRIGKFVADIGRNLIGGIALPFSRTPANVLESGLERTPIVGFFMELTNNPDVKATYTEMVTRQGIGAGMWYLGYLAGNHLDPDVSDTLKLDRLITNMGGQYGLPIAAGLAAGKAMQAGRISGDFSSIGAALGSLGEFLNTGVTSTAQNLPFPTTEFMDVFKLGNLLKGEPLQPEAETWSRRWLPRPVTPSFIPMLEEALGQDRDLIYSWD